MLAPTQGIGLRDRRRAGHDLARRLRSLREGTRVYGLIPGGLVVAAEIARELAAPLDVWLVRELGDPEHPDRFSGAFAEGASLMLVGEHGPSNLLAFVHAEARAIRRDARRLRSGRWPADIHGRTVLLVDDALASDLPMRAAIAGARKRGADRVIAAAPLAHPVAAARVRDAADELVTLVESPDVWYEDDRIPSDDERIEMLADARRRVTRSLTQ